MIGKFFNTTSLLWLLRMLLQFGGFWLVTNGYASADDIGRATGIIQEIIAPAGGVAFLIGLAANIYSTFRTKVVAGGQSVGVGAVRETLGAPAAREVVQTAKETIANKPTLWEQFTGRR